MTSSDKLTAASSEGPSPEPMANAATPETGVASSSETAKPTDHPDRSPGRWADTPRTMSSARSALTTSRPLSNSLRRRQMGSPKVALARHPAGPW